MQREPIGRKPEDIRPLTLETGVNRFAEGSVLVKAGGTHVLCTASVEKSVPKWLKGKGKGWVTAEYSMLPRATHTRGRRDREKVSGRTQEIQRLIARALRAMVDLEKLGEQSIIVDCDVIQADGGTRTASITGGCVALMIALDGLIKKDAIKERPWTGTVSAISIGLNGENILVDLDYNEDSSCDVDMNFVMKDAETFVEVQGTAEGETFGRDKLNALTDSAQAALKNVRTIQLDAIKSAGVEL